MKKIFDNIVKFFQTVKRVIVLTVRAIAPIVVTAATITVTVSMMAVTSILLTSSAPVVVLFGFGTISTYLILLSFKRIDHHAALVLNYFTQVA